jgi:inhibitor of cysteine peptidase
MGTVSRVLATLLFVTIPVGRLAGQEATMRVAGGDSDGVRVDARDNGRRVELQIGERLTVELRANPSTGYSWEVVSSGEPVLRQLGPPTFTEDSHMAGAGGTVSYEFRAEQAGTASLDLVYRRPWEKEAEPAETFSLTVVVTK